MLYIDGATKGYPRLIDAAQRLQEVDIPFVDLTNVFTDGEDPISTDDPRQLQKGYGSGSATDRLPPKGERNRTNQ